MKTIRTLNKIDKPREKLIKNGVENLKEYELLSVVLGSGTKDKDVISLSKEIIKLFEKDFERLNLENLTTIHGLGLAKASQILAALELSKRYILKEKEQIKTAKDIYNKLKKYHNKKQEYFISIYLDGANNIVATKVISIGTLNQSLVHPREVFSYAIQKRCASIIVAHNHPSGVLTPSSEDINITKRLQSSANILGIEFLDHVILSKDGFYSFKEEGLL